LPAAQNYHILSKTLGGERCGWFQNIFCNRFHKVWGMMLIPRLNVGLLSWT